PAASLESKPDPVALPHTRTTTRVKDAAPVRCPNQTFAVFSRLKSLRTLEPGGESDGKGDREGEHRRGPAAGPVPVRQHDHGVGLALGAGLGGVQVVYRK